MVIVINKKGASKDAFKWLSISFAIVFLLCLITAFIFYQNSGNFVKSSITGQGTVIELQKSGKTYYPIVKFKSKTGKEFTFKAGVGTNPPAYQIGNNVNIIYSPEDPQKAQINSPLYFWFLPILFGGLGGIFGLLSFAFLIVWKIIQPKQVNN